MMPADIATYYLFLISMDWFLRRCTYKSRTPSRIGSALPRGDARDGLERVILQNIDSLNTSKR
jgi:hypothetical protein